MTLKINFRISVKFVWYDLWIGLYVDDRSDPDWLKLYFCPFPAVVCLLELPKKQ